MKTSAIIEWLEANKELKWGNRPRIIDMDTPIEKILRVTEETCEGLRKLRELDPAGFANSPEAILLQDLESAMQTYYLYKDGNQ